MSSGGRGGGMVICHHDDRWSGFIAWQPSDLAGKDTKDKDVSS
jgi:hypothetical protein